MPSSFSPGAYPAAASPVSYPAAGIPGAQGPGAFPQPPGTPVYGVLNDPDDPEYYPLTSTSLRDESRRKGLRVLRAL